MRKRARTLLSVSYSVRYRTRKTLCRYKRVAIEHLGFYPTVILGPLRWIASALWDSQ